MIYNFSPGPGVLPLEVKQQIAEQWDDFAGTGSNVCELSHRGAVFTEVAERAEAKLRGLLSIPDDYAVLFTQGGATQQFSCIPWNFGGPAGYLVTGHWSAKAKRLAAAEIEVGLVADAGPDFKAVPEVADWNVDPRWRYLHITSNETIHGIRLPQVPKGLPLVSDMSSSLLGEQIDVSDYAAIYASSQKNLGPAGLTIVIVRRSIVDSVPDGVANFANYRVIDRAGSMHNTPPTFAWYAAGLVFEWVERQGGVAAMGRRNEKRALRLYEAIDNSGIFRNNVDVVCRSWMNVTFQLTDERLLDKFLDLSQQAGLHALKGHRAVGGLRASLYNAMPDDGVDALIEFLREFEKRHG
ncbi:MAG: phosphoserine aminotransferase [Lysobacteraceae bacterium]|nr:MAG: phosphoserine aminotransferase [Xanthomonadaceae bacterium]